MTRSAPYALYFAIFLDLAGFGMVIPDIQTRLETFGARGWLIGLALASYFLVQILVSPLWGKLSDRIGRKSVLIGCGFLSCLSMIAYARADSVLWIILSRVFAGFAAANVVAAQAYLADVTARATDAERAASLGRVGAAITAGLILGPALGGWLADVGGNQMLGLVAACASGLGALWIWVAVPAHPPIPKPHAEDAPPANLAYKNRVFPALLRDVPRLRPLLFLSFAALFALACLEGTFGRLIKAKLGLGPREFGWIFGYESLLSVIIQTSLLGWITAKIAPRRLLTGSLLLQGIGLALTPFAPNLFVLFGASTIYGIGAGLTTPTLNGLSSVATPQERQGEMFGLLQGVRSLGFLVGPIAGGVLFDWRVESPYLLAGGVMLVAAMVAAKIIPMPKSLHKTTKTAPS